MKYLAILKDCLLEALDSKVLYVMLAVSVLVVLIVGSVSYHPINVEAEVQRGLAQPWWGYSTSESVTTSAPDGPQTAQVRAEWKFDHIEDFRATRNGETGSAPVKDPWLYDYSFVCAYAPTYDSSIDVPAETKQRMRNDHRRNIETNLKSQLDSQSRDYLKDFKLTDESRSDSDVILVRVSARSAVERREDWPHQLTVLFFIRFWRVVQEPLFVFVYFFENILVCTIGAAVALLLSIVMTAFYIPNMLRKGTVDFFIVKPISRPTLLLYKYIGGLSFMLINTVVVVIGVWLVLGLQSGLWGPGFLWSIPILTFEFAIFYSVSTLFAVLTRSAVVCILMACGAWGLLWLIGTIYNVIEFTRHRPEIQEMQRQKRRDEGTSSSADSDRQAENRLPDYVYTIADVVHFVIPRHKDLDVLITRAIQTDYLRPGSLERKASEKLYESFHWYEAFGVTSVWIAATLALSCLIFSVKDY
jgi:ABC-type transport system involved in multi-copper enzyme maturation permease subunit